MKDNDKGLICTWCGDEVESYKQPDPNDRKILGECEKDGIVYVELPQQAQGAD